MLDCFLVAFQLPNLLRNLFGEGALAAAMIPRYVQERDRDAAATCRSPIMGKNASASARTTSGFSCAR